MVTLYGEVLPETTKKRLFFSVNSELGDAASVGINGNIDLPAGQAFGLSRVVGGHGAGFWRIRITFPMASHIALSCQPCD